MDSFPSNWRIRGTTEKLGIPPSEATPGKLYSKPLQGKMYTETYFEMDKKEWPVLTAFLADHGYQHKAFKSSGWNTEYCYKISGKTYLLFQMDEDLSDKTAMFMIIVGYGTPNTNSNRPAQEARAIETVSYNTWSTEKTKAGNAISSLMNEYKKTHRFRPS